MLGTDGSGGKGRRQTRRQRQRGAVLAEFGIISVLLFTLIFGIVEYGWAYAQTLDVRHGAREGARLAAVNFPNNMTGDPQTAALVDALCDRMDDNNAARNVRVSITLNGASIGDSVTVQVRSDLEALTGFFPGLSNKKLNSTIVLRLEQDATYVNTASHPDALSAPDAGFMACDP